MKVASMVACAPWVVGGTLAVCATCASERASFGFDKRACALAYENAQQLRFKQKLRLARDQLLTCGQASCPSVVNKDCTIWLQEVEGELASVRSELQERLSALGYEKSVVVAFTNDRRWAEYGIGDGDAASNGRARRLRRLSRR